MTLQYGEALKLIGGLSKPSKMPWWGWSISAEDCKVGGKLREIENSVCSSCYAMKGNYVFSNVKDAHARRRKGLEDPRFVEAMVVVLTKAHKLSRKGENRFRWHDSGDLQNMTHLKKIVAIAEQTPQIRHYLPTKEKALIKRFKGEFPSNLFIKISSPMIGEAQDPKIEGVDFATAGYEGPEVFQCPARASQNNMCLNCDACWSPGNVNYPVH